MQHHRKALGTQQREELTVERLAGGDDGGAFEEGRVGGGERAVEEGVDYEGAAGSFGGVGIRAVDHEGVMEGALARF